MTQTLNLAIDLFSNVRRVAINIDHRVKLSRWFRFSGLLLVGWCTMTTTHECGHIIGGWLGGATLVDEDLLPWHLPHSLYQPDPIPLLTLWSGPIVGVIVPIICALVFRRNWIWFVANFCLLANGSYIATAWISADRFLDTPRLLEAGAWPLSILFYCAVTIGFGYFGFRRNCIELLTPSDFFQSAQGIERLDPADMNSPADSI